MNTHLHDGLELARAVESSFDNRTSDAIMIIAPPFTHLARISEVTGNVKLAAQNVSAKESGAYTGEVSVGMLKSCGVSYVIVGHSERRSYFKESDAFLNEKVHILLANDLSPIFCCGELLEERQAETHFDVVREQVTAALKGVTPEQMKEVVIAYEPVWAIGTGVTATPDQAQEMHRYIRDLLLELYGAQVAEDTTILYGGSAKPSNAKELFSNPDVDGGLIGGASLNADDFIQIVNAF